jgi:hypothetical protein
VREGDWKLVEQYEDGSLELFNLASDPGERTNLAEQDAVRATELKAKLATWRKSVGAQEPTANPEFDETKHRALYADRDSSRLEGKGTAEELAAQWQSWRAAMNAGRRLTLRPVANHSSSR